MSKLPLALLLASIGCSPAVAQSERQGSERTMTVHVETGATRRIRQYAAWNNACEPLPAPAIVIREPAVHGTVSTQPGTTTVTAVNENGTDCFGRTMPGIVLYYSAEPGFHGTDRFVYDVVYQHGRNRHDTVSGRDPLIVDSDVEM